MLVETLILLLIILFLLYKWATLQYNFFEKRHIPFEKPFPFFGNFIGLFLKTEHFHDILKRFHMKFNTKFYGIYESRNPLVVIKDVELIKQITVKDFDHFVNHRQTLEPEDDVLFGNSLISLKDQKWRDMRTTLSPAFTGSKMRQMFQLVNEVSMAAMKHLREQTKLSSNDMDIDMKEYFTRYTNDSIASCAFGLKINSLAEMDNEFYQIVRRAMNFTGWVMLKIFLFNFFKPVMRYFKIKISDKKFTDYFMRIVLDSIKYRTAHNIVRPDMINLLIESKKSSSTTEDNNENNLHNFKWTDEEMVAQCFLFFLAGFETTALLMCFAARELMENPDVQEKLLAEIDDVKDQLDGKPLSYEKIQEMKYLDMVLSETLRKWPPAPATDRLCVKPYLIEDHNNVVQLEIGDVVWFNFVGQHYDPENFPNPTKFDPERFSDENKGNIKPFTYAPFGLGPRNCIGNRLALMEAKCILYHILTEFTFEASEKTSIPLELDKKKIQLEPKNGFWLKLKQRI